MFKRNHLVKGSVLLSLAFFAAGCAMPAKVPLSRETRSSLHTVAVAEQVKTPDGPVIRGVGYYGMGLAGVISESIERNRHRKDLAKTDRLRSMFRNEVMEHVYKHFVARLEKSNLFTIIGADNSLNIAPDAVFLLAIDRYGWFPGFTSGYMGELCVTGRLIMVPPINVKWITDTQYSAEYRQFGILIEDPEKHPIVWEKFQCALDRDTYEMEAFVNNPDTLHEVFDRLAGRVAENLIQDLER